VKIRLVVDGQSATVRDFAALLPLTVQVTDYATIERITDLPRKLSTQGSPEGVKPAAGEMTYYAPWGNFALFIQPRSFSRGLVFLGKLDTGLPIVSRNGPYSLTIEKE